MFNTLQTIQDFKNQKVETFETLYLYCLYICGGDFNQFDDVNTLFSAIEEDEANNTMCFNSSFSAN